MKWDTIVIHHTASSDTFGFEFPSEPPPCDTCERPSVTGVRDCIRLRPEPEDTTVRFELGPARWGCAEHPPSPGRTLDLETKEESLTHP